MGITSLDGVSAGEIELSDDELFGLEPRADIIARIVNPPPSAAPARQQDARPHRDIARTGKKMYKQKGTGPGPRPVTARCACRSSAAAVARWVR